MNERVDLNIPNDGEDNRELYYTLLSKVIDMQIDNFYKTERGKKLKSTMESLKQEEANLMYKQ